MGYRIQNRKFRCIILALKLELRDIREAVNNKQNKKKQKRKSENIKKKSEKREYKSL